jgi:hypothetical protein
MRIETGCREALGSEFAPPCGAFYVHFLFFHNLVLMLILKLTRIANFNSDDVLQRLYISYAKPTLQLNCVNRLLIQPIEKVHLPFTNLKFFVYPQ